MRPQAKHASYIAIKSAPDTYFLRHSYFIPRRALPLFKYHGTISCPTSVLTMPSYASMHAFPTRCRNSHAKAYRPKNRCLPDSPEIFFTPRTPPHDGAWTIFPGTFVFIRALPIALLQGSRTKDKFYSPRTVVLSTSPSPSRSPTPRNGNVPRAMKMINRHPESRQSLSNPAPKAKSETPAVL